MENFKERVKVSIIMATYNRSHFIIETLNSILNQSYRDWECIIVDDGSTDATKEVLQQYLQNDSRLLYFERNSNHKKGLPGCRNQGLELAKGKYVVFFDDDDIVHPYLLELSIKEIVTNKTDYCRYLRTTFIGDFNYNYDYDSDYNVRHLDERNLDEIIMNIIPLNSCQVLWSKTNFINNKFNEDLMYAEEWECYSRILSTGVKGISIDKILFFGRKHPHSNTGEYLNNDPVRKRSYVIAIKLVINNLSKQKLLTPNLVRFFIRRGFLLNEISVIEAVLKNSNGGRLESLKYVIGFRIYPVLKPLFNLKAKQKKS